MGTDGRVDRSQAGWYRLCLKCPPMNPKTTWGTSSKQGGPGRQLQDLRGGQSSRPRTGMAGAWWPQAYPGRLLFHQLRAQRWVWSQGRYRRTSSPPGYLGTREQERDAGSAVGRGPGWQQQCCGSPGYGILFSEQAAQLFISVMKRVQTLVPTASRLQGLPQGTFPQPPGKHGKAFGVTGRSLL